MRENGDSLDNCLRPVRSLGHPRSIGAARIGLGLLALALGLAGLAFVLRLLAPAYINSGQTALDAGDYPAAVHDFDQALLFRPDYAEAYAGRGVAYTRLNRFGPAIASFTQALEIMPDDAQTYYDRGLAYLALGKTSLARADFRQAVILGVEPVLRLSAEHYLLALDPA
jgi:tetratricopeptide (TPR) repeat protein